jgi:hypothetical protein
MDITRLRIDPASYAAGHHKTGILVPCKLPDGAQEAVDIYCLDVDSLMCWLRSNGGVNELAERTVALLLGHSLRR